MERGWLAMAIVAVAAAGCVQAPLAATLPPEAPRPPETFADAHQGCTGYLLGLLIDPVRTDAVLPPGFHLRDPAHFLSGAPTATGMALLLVAATVCAPTVQEPAWRDATAALFVRPPAVAGERPPATYDVYEVEHYSPEPAVRERLRAWGWPVANVTLRGEGAAEVREGFFAFAADGQQAQVGPLPPAWGDALFRFGGASALAAGEPGEPVVLRIWRDTPEGLGSLDYLTRLPVSGGTGYCLFRAGSTLARLAGTTACGAPGGSPLGAEAQPNLVSTYLSDLRVAGVLQRGVRAA